MSGDKKWEQFLLSHAKLRGAKNEDDVRNAWTRIQYHMAQAAGMWKSSTSRDEIVAYLRAAEETWWKPEAEVMRDFKKPGTADIRRGVEDYYPQAGDVGGEHWVAHRDRAIAIVMHRQEGLRKKRTSGPGAGVMEKGYDSSQAAAVKIYVDTLQITQAESREMDCLFDFDRAASDGLSDEGLVQSTELNNLASISRVDVEPIDTRMQLTMELTTSPLPMHESGAPIPERKGSHRNDSARGSDEPLPADVTNTTPKMASLKLRDEA